MTQPNWMRLSLTDLGQQIDKGNLDPREMVEYFLDQIAQNSDKDRIFLRISAQEARKAAQESSERAQARQRRSLYDGIPLAWKDNFDIQGQPTTAGLKILHNNIASKNAAVYQIAEQAGLICLGKTNMTELAFSGLGINPAWGTPANPFDQKQKRVPGGSSSGSAIALAQGLCCASIGTDTGGSIRTPAAWNHLVGLKTTAGLLSSSGVVPLSQTLDTVGFLTRSVADAASLYHLFSQTQPTERKANLTEMRMLVANNLVWEQIDPEIAETITNFLDKITYQGVDVNWKSIPEFEQVFELVNTHGNIVSYEASKNWLGFLEANPGCISADILERFRLGATLLPSNIAKVHQGLQELQQKYLQRTQTYSVVLMPTVVSLPPVIAELENDSQKYNSENLLSLRNTRLINLLGLSALSLPIGKTKTLGLPVGLMLVAPPFAEPLLLQVAAKLESLIKQYQFLNL